MKKTSRLLLGLLGILVFSIPLRTLACGPFFESAIFVHQAHPDFPLSDFASGKLGIPKPSYARSYLAVAYRHLSGIGLDAAEQAAVIALWDKRLGIASPSEVTTAPSEKWFEARDAILGKGARPNISGHKTMTGPDFYFEFLNCNASSFLSAAQTANERLKVLGTASAVLKDWVTAQDAVFSNCGGEGPRTVPQPLPPSAPALARADRAYQIASALFYSGSYAEAETAFREIARDPASPWSSLAPYLAVRAIIRRATVTSGSVDRDLMGKARKELETILADPAKKKIHEPSRRLLAFTLLRSDPASAAAEKSKEVLAKGAGAALMSSLDDYTYALDTLPSPVPESLRKDELTDWILTFQAETDEARARAFTRWNQTKSLPWLVAGLSKATPAAPEASALIEAGKKVSPSSAAFVMVAFHLARLEAGAEKPREARERLDALLVGGSRLPPSARNEVERARLQLSANLTDALRFVGRLPSTFSYNEDGRELPSEEAPDAPKRAIAPLLDEDGAALFNGVLPLERWVEASTSKDIPEGLRKRISLAGWVRAALLDDVKAAAEFRKALSDGPAELLAGLEEHAAAKSRDGRVFAAALAILRQPGLRPYVEFGLPRREALAEIDSFRDNWWCAGGPVSPEAPKSTGAWMFVPAAELAKGREESARLKGQGTAPDFLAQTVIDAVNKLDPGDRGAEALHLAVRATRYGCTAESTSRLSKAAFQLLKKKYPKSDWAAKTKYWY